MKKNALTFLYILFLIINITAQSKSFKKGVAYGYHKEADFQTINAYISWWYNWSIKPDNEVSNVWKNYKIDFIPMAWNNNYNEQELRNFLAANRDIKYILGFNEPNFLDQARMTPTQAAAAWPRLQKIADDFDLELVGPAVNWCGSCVSENGITYYDPYKYLDDFFAACTDCRVDYIAVHNYMCYSGALKSYLDGFKKYGKKIWLTEFACWDQNNITLDMQKSLVIGALDLLENDTMIYRYAWFNGDRKQKYPYLDLYTTTAGTLTELGKLYMMYDARHDTNVYVTVPARIEAENYSTMYGISLEATKDVDGMANVGWIDPGDWLEYNIEVPEDNLYYIYFRIASIASSSIEILSNGNILGSLNISTTGGWQNWKTFVFKTSLSAGKHKIRLNTPIGKFNINWIQFSTTALGLSTNIRTAKLIELYPSIVSEKLTIKNHDNDFIHSIKIIDLRGRVVLEKTLQTNNKTISLNIEQLSNQIYFVHIYLHHNNRIIQKIVKN